MARPFHFPQTRAARTRTTWKLAVFGMALGLVYLGNRPGHTAVTSPDGQSEVVMVRPSAWQNFNFKDRYTNLLMLRRGSDVVPIRVAAVRVSGMMGHVGQPADIWWRSDGEAFLFISDEPTEGLTCDAFEVYGAPLGARQTSAGTLRQPGWAQTLIQQKSRMGTPFQQRLATILWGDYRRAHFFQRHLGHGMQTPQSPLVEGAPRPL